jgi:hypothetical protein
MNKKKPLLQPKAKEKLEANLELELDFYKFIEQRLYKQAAQFDW